MAWATSTDASTVELPTEAPSLPVIMPTVEKLRSDSADDAGITKTSQVRDGTNYQFF